MARHNTSDEVKKEHMEKLGPDLGPVYHSLWNEVAWLQIKWQEYRELFGTNPERIDLINSAASLFFYVVQNTLWHDILLHLCRPLIHLNHAARPIYH